MPRLPVISGSQAVKAFQRTGWRVDRQRGSQDDEDVPEERVTLHYLLILAMESGIMGVFLSLDLFLFYLFWELL